MFAVPTESCSWWGLKSACSLNVIISQLSWSEKISFSASCIRLWPAQYASMWPKTQFPAKNKSPIASKALCFTGSLIVLKPSWLSAASFPNTTALLSEPPLIIPLDLSISSSVSKVNVLHSARLLLNVFLFTVSIEIFC